MLSGDVYCAAPRSVVEAVYKKMLSKRHHFLEEGEPVPIHGRAILAGMVTPGQCGRLQAYADQEGESSDGSLPASHLIADALQWPGSAGDTSGVLFPSQLKHGMYYSFTTRRLIVGLECMFANGWNVFAPPESPFSTQLSPLLHLLPENQLKSLSGNGMMLPTMAAWFVYCMMNTVRVESVKIMKEHALANQQENAEAQGHEDSLEVSQKMSGSDDDI